MNKYTDQQRIEVLARLEVNGGNVTRTARECGVPKPTLLSWRDKALAAGSTMHLTATDPVKTDYGEIWGEAAALGGRLIYENFQRYVDRPLTPSDLKNVAITAGIASDHHLDYTQGRKGTQVNVDARTQTVNVEGLTTEELRRLASGHR